MTMEMWIASEIVGMQTFLYYCWWRWCHCSLSPWRMPVITFWKWGMRFLLLFSILCPSCFVLPSSSWIICSWMCSCLYLIRVVNWIKRPPKLLALVSNATRPCGCGRLSRRKTGETMTAKRVRYRTHNDSSELAFSIVASYSLPLVAIT